MQVINTKLSIPPIRAKLVERSGLIQKLNQGVTNGFVLVSAPAGYGKSTLLSAWLGQVNFACAWLSLDAKDNELSRFLTYLKASLQIVEPTIEQFFVGEYDFNAQPDIEMLLTPLVNQLTQLNQPLCLILDDYHVIQNQAVHEVVNFLLEHRPASFFMVISTRADPPLPLARLRARSAVLELRQSNLSFTSQESAEFLNHTMALQISPDDVEHLTARTEGWIAGLQMAGLSLQGKADISGYIHSFSGENRFILDFLFDEVFQRQPIDLQDFLLQTSILERLCGPLCDAITQRNNSQSLLESLNRSNLFLIALDEEKEWYRYHTLFADLLKSRLSQISPQSSALTHQRASVWYAKNHMPSEAIHHALTAGDIDQVHQAVAGNALAMVENAELFDVLRLFKELPGHQFTSKPWLCLAYAWVKAYADPSNGMNDLLQQAEQGMSDVEEKAERDQLTSHLAAIRAYLAWMKGEANRALEFAQRGLEDLPEDDWSTRTHLLNIKGLALQYRGNWIEATQSFEAALAAGQKIGRVYETLYTSSNLAYVHLLQGHLHKAFSLCQTALRKIEESGQSSQRFPVLAYAYATKSLILLEWNELKSAVASASQGVALAEQWRQADALHFALTCLSSALGAAGELDEALTVNQRAMQSAKDISPWFARISAETEIMLLLAKGDIVAAEKKFAEFGPVIDEGNQRYHLFMEVSLLFAQNRLLDVITTLDKTLGDFKQKNGQRTWLKLLPIQALALQALGRQEEALQILDQCLAAAKPEGYVRLFVERGSPMALLLKSAKEQGIQTETISGILAAWDIPEESLAPSKANFTSPRLPCANLIEPLSSRELEVLQLLARGYSDQKIAETLFIAAGTVHKHLKNVYGKLQVHSRTEAVSYGRELNLL